MLKDFLVVDAHIAGIVLNLNFGKLGFYQRSFADFGAVYSISFHNEVLEAIE